LQATGRKTAFPAPNKIGDKTQILSLMLAARFQRPVPIIFEILTYRGRELGRRPVCMRRGVIGRITPVLAGRWARNCKSFYTRGRDDTITLAKISVTPNRTAVHGFASMHAAIYDAGYHVPETSAAFARARELASQVEDASERFSAYYGLWVGHYNRSEPAPMREMAELFLREATARPDCPETLVAHRACGFTCWYFGDFAGAHGHFQKTIELYDQARHGDFANRFGQDPGSGVEIGDALTLWVALLAALSP
jgi:hypothetical protein